MNTDARIAGAAFALLAASFGTALPAHASDRGWDWMVAPYLWAAGVATDIETTTPPSAASNDRNFDDVLDKLDGAFLMRVEGQGDHFGVFADFVYLGLADSRDFERFETESDLDARLLDAAMIWSPAGRDDRGFDIIGGLRWIDIDFNLGLDPVNPDFDSVSVHSDQTFSDLMIGARYTWVLGDRWQLTLRGDTSFGDTDGTWNASGLVQYRTEHGAWLFGYRYLDASLKPADTTIDITLSGLEVGYGFMF